MNGDAYLASPIPVQLLPEHRSSASRLARVDPRHRLLVPGRGQREQAVEATNECRRLYRQGSLEREEGGVHVRPEPGCADYQRLRLHRRQ